MWLSQVDIKAEEETKEFPKQPSLHEFVSPKPGLKGPICTHICCLQVIVCYRLIACMLYET